jgi:hypothetical protein
VTAFDELIEAITNYRRREGEDPGKLIVPRLTEVALIGELTDGVWKAPGDCKIFGGGRRFCGIPTDVSLDATEIQCLPKERKARAIEVAGYDPLREGGPTTDVTMHISGKPPHCESLAQQDAWFQEQAQLVYDFLFNNLSQGTMYRLLILLLKRQTDYYVGRLRYDSKGD